MYAFLDRWYDICIDNVRVINVSIIQEERGSLYGDNQFNIRIRPSNNQTFEITFLNGIKVNLPDGFEEEQAYSELIRLFRMMRGPQDQSIDDDMKTTGSSEWTTQSNGLVNELILDKDSPLNIWFEKSVIGQNNTPELRSRIEKKLNEELTFQVNLDQRITIKESKEESTTENPIDRFEDILKDDD